MTDEWSSDGHLSEQALSIAGDLEASHLSVDARGHLERCDDCVARLADTAISHREIDAVVVATRKRSWAPVAVGLAVAVAAAWPAYAADLGAVGSLAHLPALGRAALASLKAAHLLASQLSLWMAAFSFALAAWSFVFFTRSRKVPS